MFLIIIDGMVNTGLIENRVNKLNIKLGLSKKAIGHVGKEEAENEMNHNCSNCIHKGSPKCTSAFDYSYCMSWEPARTRCDRQSGACR